MAPKGESTKHRPGLTRELVVTTALEFTDQYGIEKLSMRKLASSLGVEAMSLYNHVKNKDDLIKGMLDVITADFSTGDENTDWVGFLITRGESMYKTLTKHPWSSITLMSTFYDGAGFLSFMDRSYGFLKLSGFTPIQADAILNAVDSFTYGFVLQKLNFPIPENQMQATARASLGLVPKEHLPNLFELTTLVAQGDYDGLFHYEFGLKALLKGFDQEYRENKTPVF
jgi:hypothetical protein